ncbi:MAG: AAA family ATPase [Bryobacterales bacterium]|nr:AAA family ATPase [Bryobacterales bacterium]
MSGSAEEQDRARGLRRPDLLQAQDNEEALPSEEDQPAAAVHRIQRIAEALDVDHLLEEELRALSEAALGLVDEAKAQHARNRDISFQRAQVEEWAAAHAEAIADAEMATDTLAALRARIDEGSVVQEGVSLALDLLEQWLSADDRYRVTHEKLKQALSDADFQSVRSLTDALEALAAERSQVCAAVDGAVAKPRSGLPDANIDEPRQPVEPETTERADSLDEVERPVDQPTPSTVALGEGVPEPATEEVPAAIEEGTDGQDRAAQDSPTRPDDEPSAEVADDPARSDDAEDGSVDRIEDAIAALIDQGRLGLAYHLSLSMPGAFPSANAIKLAVCNYVTDQRAPVAAELSELADALLHEAEMVADHGPRWRSHALFTTCAALAPALAAPGGPVAQLLTFLQPWLDDTPSLRALAKTAADVSMTGVPLPVALLREEDSLEEWRGRARNLRNETESWITNARQSTIKFQAATRVWRRMLEDWERSNGQSSLGRIFSLVVDNPIDDIDTENIKQISEYWRDHADKEIDRIDRENRSWKHTNKIKGSPRVNLRNRVNQALALSDRWLRLIAERPDKRLPYHTEQAGVLRTAVRNKFDLALEELNAVPLRQAEGAQKLLRRYAALFNDTDSERDSRPIGLGDLLNGDLLAHPSVAFDDTGQPSGPVVDFDVLWNLATRETPDFARAALERAKRGDFLGAEAAIDIAERSGRLDEESADRSRTVIEGQRRNIQSELKGRIAETSDRLDAAYAAGALTLESYDEQHDRIPLDDFSEINTFGPLFATLEGIDREINDAQARRREGIRRSLDKVRDLSQDDRNRVESAINSGRFQVAEDFVERIEHGQALPAPETTSGRPFDRFFPHFVEEYTAHDDKEGDGIGHARRVIVSRDSEAFIDASGLSEDAARDGIDLLDAWTALRDGSTSIDGLRALIGALGFAHGRIHRTPDETRGEEGVFTLQVVPVEDRGIAQLPDFGSRAGGRYRLFAVRGRTTGEAIIREVGKRNGVGSRSPNIVLFFGILDAHSRRSLARDFLTNEYDPTIVLDESLVVFLAAWRGDRLSAFFDCVSAFAFLQPFEPDAAELPPEMFFGRSAARQAILAMSHDMAHFVYGGRRLGKTTLLADVAREYRARRPGAPEELVLLINLKGTGIGENRPTEDLWRLFAEKLAEHRVVGRGTRRYETLGKSVRQWIERDQGRRVLLLVDEADEFLRAECSPEQSYRVLEQVKRLMEQTERRFKVVFAGLHNVQRAARDPNTPFAHMGEAIRIGPMLPEADGDEIQNLIRGPLEALGYRFVSNDSIIRIAAETNYYPALAQQFCKELLKTLREESYALNAEGPPYPIRPDLVDRVFNARETRDRIRNLFSWTIQLDPRYEFLTYLIAKESFDNEDARPQAMPIAAIRDAALSEWPKGFASDPSFWTFEVLLEEMVGLGILREARDKEYAIRTRNLRMLLGNDEEIERRFTDAKNKPAPAIFDPAQFRNPLSDDTPSSLTSHQQSRLLAGRYAVGLVFGTHLAGLDRVAESLRRASAKWGESLFIKEKLGPAGLRTAIRQAGRGKHGTHVVLVDMRDAWDSEVLGRALELVGGQQQQTRIVRPVFLCGPAEAWKWLNETAPNHERVEVRDVWLGQCALDFARTYLKDQDRESQAYADLEKLHQRGDLPWPLVVGTAARNKHLKSIDEAIEVTLNDEHNRQVADIRISEKTDTALRLLSTFPDVSMTADFLSDLTEDPDLSDDESTTMSPEEVIDFFSWASRLGVVCRDGNGYRLDSTYAKGLRRVLGG